MNNSNMNNLVFFGGPHGAGKTTLANKIAQYVPQFMHPELVTRTPQFPVDYDTCHAYQFQSFKGAQRILENHEYMMIAKENPNKIIIGNRCIYDLYAYTSALMNEELISKYEGEMLKSMTRTLYHKTLFHNQLMEPLAVIINPGPDVCRRHLENRWKKRKPRFMEDDMSHLEQVCASYESLRGNKNVLYIDHELSKNLTEDDTAIYIVAQWMKQRREEKEESKPDRTIEAAARMVLSY